MEEENKWYESEFATWIGQGIFILCICVGVSTCQLASNIDIKIDNTTPTKVEKNPN